MHRRCFLTSVAAALSANAPAQQPPPPSPDPFKPSEGANHPIGEGKGVHPGRVVWTRDTKATTWDGSDGRWWEDRFTDQRAVSRMLSWNLQQLSGQNNDKQAWDALFRHFNESHSFGSRGYRAGEKIAIKLNCNQDRSPEWGVPGGTRRRALNGLPSPQAVAGVVAQLIEAGVPGGDITVYEVAGGRNIGVPIVGRVRANNDRNFQAVRFVVNDDYGLGGRVLATLDMKNPVRFSGGGLPTAYLAEQVTEAKYMINIALLRAHNMAGVTLTAKNHFGSIHFPDNGGWIPAVLHPHIMRTQAMGSYNPLVDFIAHRHLGGKTMLYMLDGLYSAESNEGNVMRFSSLGDHWASSILMSQDPLAIDSVGLDILSTEPKAMNVRGQADNFLHEAAEAAKPKSGTRYGATASLGVHEHWNNASERKYSRNLGRKTGIELVRSFA